MIRRATAVDHPWMITTGAEVFHDLGDYGAILPGWLEHAGVVPYVEDGPDGPRGFILLGFYSPRDVPAGALVADLLAIAVSPPQQRQGVGRRLLDYAIERAEVASRANPVGELRLTVAEDNGPGRRLFASAGFTVIDPEHGCYDGGQRAVRMARPIHRSVAAPSR